MSKDSTFSWPQGKRAAVSLTFDDARLSQIDRGMSVLDRNGVKATFYVSLDNVERRLPAWREAVKAGHEIGNHTMTHPCAKNFAFARNNALEDYTLDRMQRDIEKADERIEELLGVTPTTFAYPCGQTYVGRAEETKSYIPLISKRFRIGRAAFNEIHNHPLDFDFAHAAGRDADRGTFEYLKTLINQAAESGGWLILFAHEVDDAGHQALPAAALDGVCRYCKNPENGIWIDTVANVGEYIRERRSDG